MLPPSQVTNIVSVSRRDVKASSNFGGIASFHKRLSHSNDNAGGKLGLRVKASSLPWGRCKSKVISMFGVLLLTAPFKITDMIVGWVSINVVDLMQIFGVWNKCLSNKSMNLSWILAAIFGKVNSQVFSTFFGARWSQFLHWLKPKPTVFSYGNFFRVRPNFSAFCDRIKSRKTFNILHTALLKLERGAMIPHTGGHGHG